ncbi:MAG TPA: hypothetical protein VFJ96_06650 [Gemmatimonadaceae bacterium]|jgi:hypothetical protein|nr:hypothetical protein [Gemmatimonadaceae bacterium]
MNTPDWDKELAKIDKHIASLPDEKLIPQPQPGAKPQPTPTRATPAGSAPAAGVPAPRRETTAFGVFGRLLLAIALGVSMLFWPYPARCGFGLFGYLAAVVTVFVAGVWSASWTWRHRAAPAHVLALLVALWGLVLGAMEVLPRVGYAVPNAGHPAEWVCK